MLLKNCNIFNQLSICFRQKILFKYNKLFIYKRSKEINIIVNFFYRGDQA